MGKAWTTKELALAKDLPAREVARLTGRSHDAIRSYRSQRGLSNPSYYWTQEQEMQLWSLRREGMTMRQISTVIGRSLDAVKYKLRTRRENDEV